MANYRKIYEQHCGPIPKGYHVHHKDFNHNNNNPLNLEALDPDDHAKKHGFLTNFIMAQSKATELAIPRSRIVHKGNKYNLGRKHTEEWKLEHSSRMRGNRSAAGSIRTQEWRGIVAGKLQGNLNALGFKHTVEYKAMKAKSMLGNAISKGARYVQQKTTCPHCGVTGGIGALKRWHFDKCRKS